MVILPDPCERPTMNDEQFSLQTALHVMLQNVLQNGECR